MPSLTLNPFRALSGLKPSSSRAFKHSTEGSDTAIRPMDIHGESVHENAGHTSVLSSEASSASSSSVSSDASSNASTSMSSTSYVLPTPPHTGMSNLVALRAGICGGTEEDLVENFQKEFPGSVKKTTMGSIQQPGMGGQDSVDVILVELNDAKAYFEELILFFLKAHITYATSTSASSTNNPFNYYLQQQKHFTSYIFFGDEEQLGIILKVRSDLRSQRAVDVGGALLSNNALSPHMSPLRLKGFQPDDEE